MKVAAVVPHWNRKDLLEALLANLREQTRPFDEVIVADNGSTDGSQQVAKTGGARVVPLDRNYGFAAAVNRGIAEARDAEWIAILNNDVTLAPDWLERLLAAGGSFAVGKVLSAKDPSKIDGTFDAISRGACPYRCGSGSPDGPLWNQRREIRIAPMTAALFRRELFTGVGPLDERFESYLEDTDFGIRCAVAGYTGVYEPAAQAHHLGSATWGQWNPDAVRLQARNQILLAAKHFRGLPAWPMVAGQLLWGLVALRHGCGMPYVRGKISGLRQLRSIRSGDHQNGKSQAAVAELVRESEREIFEIQRQTGFDRYWRVYFWLSPLS